MGETSNIAWTDATWNCIIGCSHVSPGCEHCYAETLATRYGWTTKPWGAQWTAENVQLRPKRLAEPLKWRESKRVFVNSISDLFHEEIPFSYIAATFGIMAATPWHTYQILTKRPKRMWEFFDWLAGDVKYVTDQTRVQVIAPPDANPYITRLLDYANLGLAASGQARRVKWPRTQFDQPYPLTWPLPNVWLGVSAEDQRRYDERAPILVQCPAAVRFISYEPALEAVDFGQLAFVKLHRRIHGDWPIGHQFSASAGVHKAHLNRHGAVSVALPGGDTLGVYPREMEWVRKISWVICGGESGPKRRPFDLDWARQARDQCVAADVAFFFKQDGGPRPGMNPTLDGETWHQFPKAS